jgi:type III secretion protein L
MVELVALSRDQPALLGPGAVIPAALGTRLIAVEALHEEATRKAEALVRAAEAEVEAVREAARAEGLAAATEEIQDRLFEIAEASVAILAQSEERILDLALQIAERIIGAMPSGDIAAQVTKRSLQLVPLSRFVRLRVTPANVTVVQEKLDAVLPAALSQSTVEVVGDARIRDAGCVLETDAGLIDATIESQIAAIRRGLERSLSRRTAVAG